MTGGFTAAGGAISNSNNADVSMSGGNANFTYGGTIPDDVGDLVSISGATGGTKDFNGNITDGDDGDGSGVSLSSNTGATVRFDGGLTLSTGGQPAFRATGGGTLAVTDPPGATANTIATTNGTALNVSNTTIHAADLNFRRISAGTAASGPANAILLNSTGTGGNLAVTGDGGSCTVATPTCTGGEIRRTTGDAISMTNTASPSLNRVNVHDAAGNGVLASEVSGTPIANSIFVDNSDDTATNNEANLRMHNLSGTSSVTNSVFREAVANEVYWTPTAGTMTMNWNGSTVGPDAAGSSEPGCS